MRVHQFLRIFVHQYGWVHLGVGMIGNALFLIGSILFLPDWAETQTGMLGEKVKWRTVGVWFFIAGATLMLIGSVGEVLVSLRSKRKARKS
ncbi:YrhK family protein [Dinoroseobacter sp. PD6]|uniref:YrhK family protein n=1 Tax=Dinoroseobacter sp. PD6 TaxID=3028384 RepID=UPI00237A56B5|nr:YrhK family protein [Dinoroseobacter sp. PD6]MDD9719010.1 YrhK family protein [Dinoroseobacter sp. PD6]